MSQTCAGDNTKALHLTIAALLQRGSRAAAARLLLDISDVSPAEAVGILVSAGNAARRVGVTNSAIACFVGLPEAPRKKQPIACRAHNCVHDSMQMVTEELSNPLGDHRLQRSNTRRMTMVDIVTRISEILNPRNPATVGAFEAALNGATVIVVKDFATAEWYAYDVADVGVWADAEADRSHEHDCDSSCPPYQSFCDSLLVVASTDGDGDWEALEKVVAAYLFGC